MHKGRRGQGTMHKEEGTGHHAQHGETFTDCKDRRWYCTKKQTASMLLTLAAKPHMFSLSVDEC